MSVDPPLKLTNSEISAAFANPGDADVFPPILTIEEAAALLQVPVETLRDWRSRGLLKGCSRRKGKRVRFFRDRLIQWYFNE